jgi:hypothetical protein
VLQTGAVICPISNIWPISIGERPWRIETAPRHRFSPGPDFAPQLQSFKQNRWPNSIHNPGAPQRGVHAVSAVQAVLSSPQRTAPGMRGYCHNHLPARNHKASHWLQGHPIKPKKHRP